MYSVTSIGPGFTVLKPAGVAVLTEITCTLFSTQKIESSKAPI